MMRRDLELTNPNKDLKPTCLRRNRSTMKCRAKCCRKPKVVRVEPGEQEKLWLVGTPEQQLRSWINREN